jgi:hypothetical protein
MKSPIFRIGQKVVQLNDPSSAVKTITKIIIDENSILYHLDNSNYTVSEDCLCVSKEPLTLEGLQQEIEKLKERVLSLENSILTTYSYSPYCWMLAKSHFEYSEWRKL